MALMSIIDRLLWVSLAAASTVTAPAALSGATIQKCWKDTPCDSRFSDSVFKGRWEANIIAPTSRTVTPKSLVETLKATTNETVIPLSRSIFDPANYPLILKGNGSQLVFDFGQELGGLVTLRYSISRGDDGDNDDDGKSFNFSSRKKRDVSPRIKSQSLGLAFTESSDFIGQWSDSSNGAFQGSDGAIYANLDSDDSHDKDPASDERVYTMPDSSLRGGFRYLTVFLVDNDGDDDDSDDGHTSTPTTVTLRNVTLELAFQPTWPNLRAYQGYFDSNDPVLNRIWYAGAYTLQTNAVPPTTGRRVPFLKTGWANDGLLGPGHTILVDGAKRDRAVWPGDMGVAVPSLFVSTGDMESVKNALQTMYNNQNSDGSFPEAGPPLLQQGSDTYHMWTMIGTYNYVLYTNDTAFLARNWAGYQRAMAFITAKQADETPSSASGLLHVTGVRDWARLDVGTNMTEAQVILYHTLTTGAQLAAWLGDNTGISKAWAPAAERLLNATLEFCYDPQQGLFRDNASPLTTIYPQDANALALSFGMTGTKKNGSTASAAVVDPLAASLSDHLIRNWLSSTDAYPVTPELPGHISPFISSWEVRGHFMARKTDRALELMRTLWGRYLDRPDGSQSSLVEGLLARIGGQPSFGYRYNRGYGGTHNDTTVAASYTSHSHGWSAGPTSALTEFILGLSVTGVVGSNWQFAPQLGRGDEGGLSQVEGGFVTSLGKFQAKWECHCCKDGSCNNPKANNSFDANINTPLKTTGVLILPIPGNINTTEQRGASAVKVVLDGNPTRKYHLKQIGGHANRMGVVVLHVHGGWHTVSVAKVSSLFF